MKGPERFLPIAVGGGAVLLLVVGGEVVTVILGGVWKHKEVK